MHYSHTYLNNFLKRRNFVDKDYLAKNFHQEYDSYESRKIYRIFCNHYSYRNILGPSVRSFYRGGFYDPF